MANSQTLGSFFTPALSRADIEVPNPLVAMDAWRGLACYPWSSFYPLSFRRLLNGRSDHYVLVSHLRGMSALQLGRLVPLYYLPRFHCGIADLNKPLRYLLGGFRPKQTAHQILSPPIFVGELEIRTLKSGISLTAPVRPKSDLQSLPPMLRINALTPISSCSKASGVFLSTCR